MRYILNKDGTKTKMTDYDYFCQKFGEEMVAEWLDGVEMDDLFSIMPIFSNDCLVDSKIKHRNKHINILESILQESVDNLYPTVTYGTRPNSVCTCAIGHLTGRKYGNVEIAIFLIQEKISDLKRWLLEEYCFSEKEENLLHFFQDRKGIFVDEEDSYYTDYNYVDRFDIEEWFDNSSSHKKYIVTGRAERWNIKGEDAYGYFDKTFDSILEAIDETTKGCGICYMKIYENNRGKLFVDVRHHDGFCEFEVRELTKKGEQRYYNADCFEEDIISKLANGQGYTKNVSFSKNY